MKMDDIAIKFLTQKIPEGWQKLFKRAEPEAPWQVVEDGPPPEGSVIDRSSKSWWITKR